MRLLVLGASGGIGRWVTRLAAEDGHQVTALVRPQAAFDAPPRVKVQRGDVLDPSALDAALAGQAVVISSLGIRRAGKSPWAPLLSPADFTTRVARVLVPAMQRAGVRRLVAVSAGGVGDSYARATWPVRRLVRTANVGVQYRDLEAMEAVLAASDLDWIVARPVTLVDGAPRANGGARAVERYGVFSMVRRSEVARWLLAAAEDAGAPASRRVLIGR